MSALSYVWVWINKIVIYLYYIEWNNEGSIERRTTHEWFHVSVTNGPPSRCFVANNPFIWYSRHEDRQARYALRVKNNTTKARTTLIQNYKPYRSNEKFASRMTSFR